MNYQYRFGTSFKTATKTLYEIGGLGRYYQGLLAALFQGMSSAQVSISNVGCISDEVSRTDLEIRRHGCECGDLGFIAIKFVFERLTFTHQDDFCFTLVILKSFSMTSLS
jgi:hypothetical protein